MPADVSGTDALLALVALVAGTVDAIAGGGGLLTVPALLAAGLPPHLALGTNKGQSVFGSGAALVRFSRARMVPLRRAGWTFPLAFIGALGGAQLVLWVRPEILRPVVLVLLLAAAVGVLLRPRVHGGRAPSAAVVPAAALALGVGAYDGFFGPGTGTLLIVGLAGLLHLPLQHASAEAKAINFASNLGGALLFASRGTVVWHTALPMAAGQLVGGWLGAHLTVRGGDRVVRWVLLCVVAGLVLKLSFDALRHGRSLAPGRGEHRGWGREEVRGMQTRRFGWTGVRVPVIGQGTWQMEGDPAAEALAALQAGLDAGMTHVDTAELYGSGRVESLIARAIADRREQIFLVSKVMPDHASRTGTVQACEASLRRLGTDHLDCYLLHWPGPHPLEDTIAAFEQLVEAGKIRSWGLSNFDVDELDETLAIAGPRRIACNQVLYHLRARDIEDRVLPWCVEHEVALVGYSPFGSGDFPQPQSRGGKVLGEIARKHGVTTHQVALTFLSRDPHVFAIPKSAKVARVRENAAAAGLRLGREEIARLEEVFPVRRGRGLPTL